MRPVSIASLRANIPKKINNESPPQMVPAIAIPRPEYWPLLHWLIPTVPHTTAVKLNGIVTHAQQIVMSEMIPVTNEATANDETGGW